VRDGEVVFFAESSGNAQKIMKLDLKNPYENTKKEIYKLTRSKLVAFSTGEGIDEATRSLFILDDQQKICQLDFDGSVQRVISLDQHALTDTLKSLQSTNWLQVHFS